jgi:hypothetical protein
MKKITFAVCLFSFLMAPFISTAQKNEEIQIKIVEETIDENGNIQKSVKVMTGDEAKAYKLRQESEGLGKEIHVEIEEDSLSNKRIIIRSEGEEKVIKLNEMDGDLKWDSNDNIKVKVIKKGEDIQFFNDEEDQIIILKGDDKEVRKTQKYKIVIDGEDGNTEVIEWEGEGDMPLEIKALMKEKHMDLDEGQHRFYLKEGNEDLIWVPEMDGKDHEMHMEHFFMHEEDQNTNKAFLGVTIENGSKGIRIIGFTEGSAAEEAGLLKGDEIFKVGKVKVRTIEELVSALKNYSPGDEVKIKYFRNGKRGKVLAMLKERPAQKFEFRMFDNGELGDHPFIKHPNHRDKKHIIIEVEKEKMAQELENMEREIEKKIMIEMEGLEDNMEKLEEELLAMELELADQELNELNGELELNAFKAYPNPTRDQVSLSFETKDKGDLSISLVDVSGKWVLKEMRKDFSGKFEQTFNISGAAKGNVVIRITQNGKLFTETIVVE